VEYLFILNIGSTLQVYCVTIGVQISVHISDMFALEISKAF